ncbi:MAG: NlpC/P60 family protein [Microthrixaceae bacterium]
MRPELDLTESPLDRRVVRSRRGPLRVRRGVAALLSAGLVAGITLSGGGASAQSVESLRARAEQLADELADLEHRSSELNEQFLATQERLAELQSQQDANQAAVAEAQAQVDATRGQAASYLVEAYVGAGAHKQVLPGAADPNDAVNSQVMLEVLRGDREMAAQGHAASKADLEERSAQLEATSAELSETKDRQAELVGELEAGVARHDQLVDSANQELQSALAEERQRREAEEAACAAEAARQAAARAAQQAAAQQGAATQSAGRRAASAPTTVVGSGRQAAAARPTAPAPSAPASPAPVSAPNGRASAAIAAAQSRLGTPYRWGGTTPAGFDCSGLMLWSWAQAGVSLPRTSGAQRSYTQRISFDQLQPGDLVFSGNPVYHVGMYIGGGQMIHSPQTGDVVKISAVRTGSSTTFGRIP